MLSKVLSLNKLSCPQNWNIEQEKDRESGRQASEAQREKTKEAFFVGRTMEIL